MRKNTYQWSGITSNGEKTSGEIAAFTANLAKLAINKKGVTILTFELVRNHFRFPSKNKLTLLDIRHFFRELGTLLQAGVPILQSFTLLINATKNPILNKFLLSVRNNLEAGCSLSYAFKQFPHYIDSFSTQLVYLGEQTGKLDTLLLQIADHHEKRALFTKKLQQAFLYPAILLTVSILISLLMLIFVIPQFATLFMDQPNKLPYLTILVIHLSFFIRNFGWIILLFIFFLLSTLFYFKKIKLFQFKYSQLGLSIPFIKKIYHQVLQARFARGLVITLSAGFPLREALQMIIPVFENRTYEKAVQYLHAKVGSGHSLHQAMKNLTLFSDTMIHLTQVGEEAGKLIAMQEKIAQLFESQVEDFLLNLGTILEPLIIAILGVLIGGMVIAMYLPIFKLGTVI